MPLKHLSISRRRLAILLGMLAMLGPFSIDTIFPAFHVLAADFAVSDAAIQQSISIYLLGYALMALLHGALSDAYGRKPVILAGLALFLVASMGCALADNLPQLLLFRFIQGLSAGVGLIVGRAVIRDVFDGDEAQRMMSLVSMIFSVAPAMAPIIGGYILAWSNWQSIFWFLSALTAMMLLAVAFYLPESHAIAKRVPIHPQSLARAYIAMLGNRRFRLLALAGTFMFGALFLYIAAAPAYVMGHMGLNETQFGWFFVPTIAGMSIGAFVSGRLAGKVTGQRMVHWGYMLGAGATLVNLIYAATASSLQLPWAVLPMSMLAFGIALVFPILTIALLDMYPNIRGTAASMQAFISLSANALIAGLLVPLVSQSLWQMAALSLLFVLLAFAFWRAFLRLPQAPLHCPNQAAAFEPMDEL